MDNDTGLAERLGKGLGNAAASQQDHTQRVMQEQNAAPMRPPFGTPAPTPAQPFGTPAPTPAQPFGTFPEPHFAETLEDAINAMPTAVPSAEAVPQTVASFDLSEADYPPAPIPPEPQSAEPEEGTASASDAAQFEALQKQMEALSDSFGAQFGKLSDQINTLQTAVSAPRNDVAVETLRRSLALHQTNEDKIYKELEEYRKNQYFNYIKPFLEFLITMLTDMNNSVRQYEEDKTDFVEKYGEAHYEEIINLQKYFADQIAFQLQIQGVEIVEYQPETAFIATEQMIGKPVLTEDPALVGKVARVDSACYKYEDKILRKAKVSVYKAAPKSAPAAEA